MVVPELDDAIFIIGLMQCENIMLKKTVSQLEKRVAELEGQAKEGESEQPE